MLIFPYNDIISIYIRNRLLIFLAVNWAYYILNKIFGKY